MYIYNAQLHLCITYHSLQIDINEPSSVTYEDNIHYTYSFQVYETKIKRLDGKHILYSRYCAYSKEMET